MKVNPELCHDLLRDNAELRLSFYKAVNYPAWREKVKDKFLELTGIKNIVKNSCEPNFEIEKIERKDGYKQIRYTIESEKGSVVPVYILIPDGIDGKKPVAITLQGHSSGFHNSIGEPKSENEKEYALGRGMFAVQAVKRGYIAVAIEQRGMGERRPVSNMKDMSPMCTYEAMTALSLGRTILGERMWDVSKVIDSLSNFPECDMDNIFITGNSGGGTMSFYAACYDERIKLSAPSCAFCSYKASIMDIFHCACNYIPNVMTWFEMEDLACLIAPRKLLVIAGRDDNIFPIQGVRSAFENVKNIYAAFDAHDKCKMIETDKGHWWCEDFVWDNIKKFL